jgi:hypothetical protein
MSWAELNNDSLSNRSWTNIECNSISTSSQISSSGKLNITNSTPSGTANILINQTVNNIANDIAFQSNGVNSLFVGYDQTNANAYILSNGDLDLYSGGVERVRLLSTGLPLNNSITQVLGLNGSTLSTKNNIIDTTSIQTIQNKIFDATNTYDTMTFNNLGVLVCKKFYIRGSLPANGSGPYLAIPIPNNSSVSISVTMTLSCISGGNTGYSNFLYDYKAVNIGGSVNFSFGNNQAKSEGTIAGVYINKLTPTISNTLTTITLGLTSTIATGPTSFGGEVSICYT